MTSAEKKLVRVVCHLPKADEDWPRAGSERVWAAEVPGRPLHAEIRNVLAYGTGLSFGDAVLLSPMEDSEPAAGPAALPGREGDRPASGGAHLRQAPLRRGRLPSRVGHSIKYDTNRI